MAYLPSAAAQEVNFPGVIQKVTKGIKAKRVQEWLCFHGCGTTIDSDFGSGTEGAVKVFQGKKKLPVTGSVNQKTWDVLVAPLLSALSTQIPSGISLDDAVLRIAKAHLAQHPLELGADNCGPWVRAYTGGQEGPSWRWCAAFVTFVLKQACDATKKQMPIVGSPSCDILATQAKKTGRFVTEALIKSGKTPWSSLGRCQIFLVRRSQTDWVHTGFSFDGNAGVFTTIEGNTNDEGSANGYEVCRRTRGLPDKDFIKIL